LGKIAEKKSQITNTDLFKLGMTGEDKTKFTDMLYLLL